MKIYFTASLHNKDIDRELYRKIVTVLEDQGHSVHADHILKTQLVDLDSHTASERSTFYEKLNKWMSSADLVVCEVSYPSTINIGHEVSLALDKGKPVLALYQKGRAPGVLQGIKSDRFMLIEYTLNDLKDTVVYGLEEAMAQVDVRFNFFISPQIGKYLDWVSQKKRIPRAVYLRKLIEEEMKGNTEYSESK
ncbi:MAG: nucleoside 2-deoxyribosyltransferase [Microgenomates group bacterium]